MGLKVGIPTRVTVVLTATGALGAAGPAGATAETVRAKVRPIRPTVRRRAIALVARPPRIGKGRTFITMCITPMIATKVMSVAPWMRSNSFRARRGRVVVRTGVAAGLYSVILKVRESHMSFVANALRSRVLEVGRGTTTQPFGRGITSMLVTADLVATITRVAARLSGVGAGGELVPDPLAQPRDPVASVPRATSQGASQALYRTGGKVDVHASPARGAARPSGVRPYSMVLVSLRHTVAVVVVFTFAWPASSTLYSTA